MNKYDLLTKPVDSLSVNHATGLPFLLVSDVQTFINENSENEHELDSLQLFFDCIRMLSIEDQRHLFDLS